MAYRHKHYTPGRMNAAHAQWSRDLKDKLTPKAIASLLGVSERSVKDAQAGRTFKYYDAETDRFSEVVDGTLLWYTSQRECEPE